MKFSKYIGVKLSAVVLLMSSSGLALAQETYVGVHGMWTDLDDFDFDVAPGTVTSDFDSGSGFGIVVGKRFGDIRGELELSMRDNDIDSHSLGGAELPGSKGEAQSTAFMLNGYYDLAPESHISPYVGAGIGIADVEFENFGVAPIPDVLNDSDNALAYQFMAGVNYSLSDAWQLFAEYRYFATDDVEVTTSAVTGGVDNAVDYETNNLLFGARYMF